MLLINLSAAWVAGIFLGSKFLEANFNFHPVFIFVGLIPFPLLFLTRQHRKAVILASLCLILLLSGAFYFQKSLPTADENHLRFYNDRGTVEIKGLAGRDPELGAKTTRLRLSAREIRLNEEWREVSGRALLVVPRYPSYEYGDVLLVTGKLETPPQLDEFDYGEYLARQEIYSTMLYPEIKVIETGMGFKPLEGVYSLRYRLSQTLTEVLPEPQAALAQGIILGIRNNIPSSVKADFSRTGTAHLLAISGLHLSIVAGILLSFGIWLFGRRGYLYVWLALGGIWLYALLTGMHLPVVRGAIMASLFLIAELLGRQRSAAAALSFAAAIMVGINPQILWEASFQMSFTAMAGLIFIFPLIQSLFRKAVRAILGEGGAAVSVANFVADSFSVSLGAVLAVWPLVAHYFGVISLVGPLATFFALFALPGIIITGALAGGLGLIALPGAQVIAWFAWLFLSYLLLVVKVFAFLPSFEGVQLSPLLIWVYYSTLSLLVCFSSNKSRMARVWQWLKSGMDKSSNLVSRLPVKWVVSPLLVIAILVSVTAATMPDDRLHASFLDVGQGDAILVQRGSQQVLIDGGPRQQAITLALGKEMPFWDRTIELVILTHPHADHITGLVEVLKRYKVRQVLYPASEYESPAYDEWLRLLREKNIKYTLAQAGQQIDLGSEVIIEVLNPQVPLLTGTESDIDNNGVMLRLETGEVSFLLTADIMWQAESELVASRANLKSTVLKVAHHGSATSTTVEFLAVVNPRLAVISVGENNSFGHPSSDVMDRLEEKAGKENIYRTAEQGTVEFITDGERLWVKVGR
ncbi:MAG: DNA internalization-related competence protein ComEC/Rec2 [Dehalococcoidales bacterium]|nr:DNA internalization-related competence protein ComEC/Rec2 [Dehalococcoidales bacterium]